MNIGMSAFGGKADMAIAMRNVRLWPKADIETDNRSVQSRLIARAGGLEPILVQVDRQRVIATAAEHIAHPEEHAAQRRIDAAVVDRIDNRTMQHGDDAALAANVVRRARIAGGVRALDLHGVADPKA